MCRPSLDTAFVESDFAWVNTVYLNTCTIYGMLSTNDLNKANDSVLFIRQIQVHKRVKVLMEVCDKRHVIINRNSLYNINWYWKIAYVFSRIRIIQSWYKRQVNIYALQYFSVLQIRYLSLAPAYYLVVVSVFKLMSSANLLETNMYPKTFCSLHVYLVLIWTRSVSRMRCPTGIQEVAGSILGLATYLS